MGDLLQPVHLIVLATIFGLFLVIPVIFYILALQKVLSQCAPVSRTMEPGMAWLLLVPVVNLVFHFFIVFAISKSVANEFASRGASLDDPKPGESLGLAMCICGACSIIPVLGFVTAVAHLVLWIMYWLKVGEFSRKLEFLSRTAPAAGC